MERYRILVVDDEEALCEVLKFNLEHEGYQVDTASSSEEALTYALEGYSLIILDVMMGELSGFSFARILKSRPQTAHIPIIFCTARTDEHDVVKGLDMGADDYIVKPFSLKEVLARVRSVLRRSQADAPKAGPLRSEGLEMDDAAKKCYADGVDIALTKTEYEILSLLVSRRGNVLSREEILARIWGPGVIVLDRTIDVNMTRIRKKLGKYGYKLVTRSGYGYAFEP